MGFNSLVERRQTFLATSVLQSPENHLLPLAALILAERDEHIRVFKPASRRFFGA